jgi:hypothetical protein
MKTEKETISKLKREIEVKDARILWLERDLAAMEARIAELQSKVDMKVAQNTSALPEIVTPGREGRLGTSPLSSPPDSIRDIL